MNNIPLELKFKRSFSLFFFGSSLLSLILGMGVIWEYGFFLSIPFLLGAIVGFGYLIYLIPIATKIHKKQIVSEKGEIQKLLNYYLYLLVCASPYIAISLPYFFIRTTANFYGLFLMQTLIGFLTTIFIIFGKQIIKESKK